MDRSPGSKNLASERRSCRIRGRRVVSSVLSFHGGDLGVPGLGVFGSERKNLTCRDEELDVLRFHVDGLGVLDGELGVSVLAALAVIGFGLRIRVDGHGVRESILVQGFGSSGGSVFELRDRSSDLNMGRSW